MFKKAVLYLVGGLVCLFASCVQHELRPDELPIRLIINAQGVSKADALAAGDPVSVFARIDGTETYFLEAAKFTTGADGKSLAATPGAYYPETKQAVNFYAYFPYHTGTFSVPTDQSTVAALKKADLCWATGSSTPVSSSVLLSFDHRMARLVVSANQPTAKIVAPNAFAAGMLDVRTGVFAHTSQGEVSTTGGELILPAQTLARLILNVGGVEYVFDGAITLEAGKTTTINLTLNPSTKTATLSGSSTTQWTTSLAAGAPTQSVLNTLKLHWPNVATQASTVNKMVLTIQDLTDRTTADYTVPSGIAYADGVFTLPFSSSVLHYPYQITQIRSYAGAAEVLPMVNVFSGPTVYKSGVQTVGVLRNPINPPTEADYVVINGLKWAKGNLIASNATASNFNGCKIGAPTDAGLYFQFGSLIGWKGGAQANGGTGQGLYPSSWEFKSWGGASFSWANDAMVWPTSMTTHPNAWQGADGANISTLNNWYFNYSAGIWSTEGANIREFADLPTGSGTLGTGRYAHLGIGDPCTYYLGGAWRLPNYAELNALVNLGRSGFTSYNGTQGAWLGGASGSSSTALWFVSNGYRRIDNAAGGVNYTNTSGGQNGINQCFYRVSEIKGAIYGYAFWISSTHGLTWLGGGTTVREQAGAIRCVSL